MPEATLAQPDVPVSKWGPIVVLAWLLPGGGHVLLGRHVRGAILGGSVLIAFLLGLALRGSMFRPQTGDLLTTLIYCGGFLGNVSSGILYLIARWFGYDQPDMAGHSIDYGTKFLVIAGLFNILAMVDAYEIATKKKD